MNNFERLREIMESYGKKEISENQAVEEIKALNNDVRKKAKQNLQNWYESV